MKVLVVDDSRLGRRFVQRTLGLLGVPETDISEAEDGAQALGRIEAGGIDVAFLDLNMPKMDGIQLVKALSERGLLKKMRVVIASSLIDEARKDLLEAFGVQDFLKKPFTPEALREVFQKGAAQ